MKNMRTSIAAMMLVLGMSVTACGNAGDTTSSDVNTSSTESNANNAESQVASQDNQESQEESAPTETPTEAPTETPTPIEERRPNFDYTLYLEGSENFSQFLERMANEGAYDKLAWINVSSVKDEFKGEAIDGDSVELPDKYCLSLYVPKKITDAFMDETDSNVNFAGDYVYGHKENAANTSAKVLTLFLLDDSIACSNLPATVNVTYEDGSQESITVYLTHEPGKTE